MSAELSEITRSTLLEVEAGLDRGKGSTNFDAYAHPIWLHLKDDQPILGLYATMRARATAKYRDTIAVAGYMLGTAIGYDTMTRHAFSLGRKADVTYLHITSHDPVAQLALMTDDAKVSESMLDEVWFDQNWVSARFSPDLPDPSIASPELAKYIVQLQKAPVLTDYLGHLERVFNSPEQVMQGVMTGVFDQEMIYRYRLLDTVGPDKRYVVVDGSRVLSSSPTDILYAQNPPQG